MHICFDIDGTLCEMGADLDFDDGDSILKHTRPNHAALKQLRQLMEAGCTVSFVTGRHEKVAWAPFRQLRLWLDRPNVAGIDILHRTFEPYEMMRCVVYKMDALRILNPDIYVGDLPMDQTAAAAAGVSFLPAEWFAKGHGIEHLVKPDYRPEWVRALGGLDADVPVPAAVDAGVRGRVVAPPVGNVEVATGGKA